MEQWHRKCQVQLQRAPPPHRRHAYVVKTRWEGNTPVQIDGDAGVHKGSFSDKKIRNQIGEAPPKET